LPAITPPAVFKFLKTKFKICIKNYCLVTMVTQVLSKPIVANSLSLSKCGGFLILIIKQLSGIFSIIVNCDPCGCQVKQ
jgi:hypothetical protein